MIVVMSDSGISSVDMWTIEEKSKIHIVLE